MPVLADRGYTLGLLIRGRMLRQKARVNEFNERGPQFAETRIRQSQRMSS